MQVTAEGRTFTFPDDATQEEITEALNTYLPSPEAGKGEEPGTPQASFSPEEGDKLEPAGEEPQYEAGPVDPELAEENSTWSLHPDEAGENIAAEYLDAQDIRATMLKAVSAVPKSLSLNAYDPEEGTIGVFGWRTKLHDGLASEEFYKNHPILGGSPSQRVRENTTLSSGVSLGVDLFVGGPVWAGVRKGSYGLLNKFVKANELKGKAKVAYHAAGEGSAAAVAGAIAAPKVEDVPMYATFGGAIGAGVPVLGGLYRLLANRLEGRVLKDANEVRDVIRENLQKEAEEANKFLPVDEQIDPHEVHLSAHNLTDDLLADAGGDIKGLTSKIDEVQRTVAEEAQQVGRASVKLDKFEKMDQEIREQAPDLEAETISELETLQRFHDPIAMSHQQAEEMIEELWDSMHLEARIANGEPVEHVYQTLFHKLNEYVNTRRINANVDWSTISGRMLLRMDDKLKQVLTPESHAQWKQRALEMMDEHSEWTGMDLLAEKTNAMLQMPEHVLLFRSTQANAVERLKEMILQSRANPDNDVMRLQAAVQYRRLMDYTEMFMQFKAGTGRSLNAFGVDLNAEVPKNIYPDFQYLLDDAADVGQEALTQVKKSLGRKKIHSEAQSIIDEADKIIGKPKGGKSKSSRGKASQKKEQEKKPKTLEEQLEAHAKSAEKSENLVFTDDDYTPNLEEVTQAANAAVERTALAVQRAEQKVKKLEAQLAKGEGLSERKPHGPKTEAEQALAEARQNAAKAKEQNRKAQELKKKLEENEKEYPKPKKSVIRKLSDKALLEYSLKRFGGKKSIEAQFDEFLDAHRSGSSLKVQKKTESLLNAGVEAGRTSKLSSMITHAWNFASLVARVGMDSFVDTFVYMGGKLSRNPMRMQQREFQRRFSARFNTMWTELKGEVRDPYKALRGAIKNAPDYWKNTSYYDMALDILSTPEKFEEFLKWGLLDPYVATEGTHSKFIHSDFMKAKAGEIMGQKVKELLDTPSLEILWKIFDAYGASNRVVSYGVMARMDNLFGKQSYESELQGMLADIMERHGKDEEWAKGIYQLVKEYRQGMATGTSIPRKVSPEVAALVRKLDAQALRASEDARWMSRLDSDLGKKTQSIASHPAFILGANVWFNRTPAALMKYIYENNPAMLIKPVRNFLSPKVADDLAGRNGHRAQMQRLAHMSLVTTAMAGFWTLAGNGRLIGSVRPSEYNVYNAAQMQPNSFNVGTAERPAWLSHLRMEPFSTMATIVADLRAIHDNFWATATDPDSQITFTQNVEDALTSMLFTIISLPMDRIMTKGLGDALRIFMDSEFQGEHVRKYKLNYLGGMLPFGSLGRWLTNETDEQEYKVKIQSAWDMVKATYGFTDGMTVERDILGNPVPKNTTGYGAFRVAEQRVNSPVYMKMLELGMEVRPMSRDFQNFEFSDKEYSEIEEIIGDKIQLEKQLNEMLTTSMVGLSDRELKQALTEAIGNIRNQAKYEYIMSNPELAERFDKFMNSKADFMSQKADPVDVTNALEVKKARHRNQQKFEEKADRPFWYTP